MPVCKISSRSDDWLPSYGILSIFSMASVRYFRLMKTRVFFQSRLEDLQGSYDVFSISKLPSVRHLGFDVTS